jgi:hypothetical protein
MINLIKVIGGRGVIMLLGIELLDVHRLGVDLTGLPERETLERILAERQIRVRQR